MTPVGVSTSLVDFSMTPTGTSNTRNVCIYGLYDPRDGIVRYVGRTSNPAARQSQHRRPDYGRQRAHRPLQQWVDGLRAESVKPCLRELEWVPEEIWPRMECEWIAEAKFQGKTLLNLTNGGGQTMPTEAHKANIKARTPRGEKQNLAKLTDAKVLEIRHRYANGESQKKLGQAFGVAQNTVSHIVIGETWTHVGGPIFTPKVKQKIFDSELLEIQRRVRGGESRASVARSFGITPAAITHWMGEEKHVHPISEENKLQILRLVESGIFQKDIAKIYGVTQSRISMIASQVRKKVC